MIFVAAGTQDGRELAGYLLKWPLTYVFPLTFFEDAAAALLAYRRYRKGMWKRQLV